MNINPKKKDTCTATEKCSQCSGQGYYNRSTYDSQSVDINGRRTTFSYSDEDFHGCDQCGGSGSFPTIKAYSTGIFKGSAQSQYDREFAKAIKKGSGKVKVTYETFPCRQCGTYHGELTSDGNWKGQINRSFTLSGPTSCEGHTEIKKTNIVPASGGFF